MQALRVVFVVLALAVAGLLGWRASHPAAPARLASTTAPHPSNTLPQLGEFPTQRRSIEDELATTPGYSGFFVDFKRDFPGDYERIVDGFAARAATERHLESPDLYLAETLRSLRQTRGILAAQADADRLGKVFDIQAQILTQLAATAPTLCVDFLYGGASEPFLHFSGDNRDLIAAMAEAALQATFDGQTHHIQRFAPSIDDFNLLEQGLVARGLDAVEIGALLDGKMPDPPLPAERMCAAGRAYLDALQNLPEETRLKMFALAVELMARS